MTKQEAQDAIAKHGSQDKAAEALGVSRRQIKKALNAKLAVQQKVGRSLSDFRSAYDRNTIIPAKVKTALAELGKAWEYESEFVQRAGVTFNDLGNYREAFEDFWMQVRRDGKRVWCGNADMMKEMKGMV